MRSRFDSSRFDSSLLGLQWALRLVILAMAVLALAACSDDDPTGNGGDIVSVQVSASALLVEAGDSVLVSAAPKRADGTTRTDVSIGWFSTDTSIARVEGRAGQKAMVVGRRAGHVQIRAMAGNKTGQAALEITETAPANPPVIGTMHPASAPEGSGITEITITGQNFTESSLVQWNGVSIATQFVSPTEIRGIISPANLAQAGTAEVAVRTGPPGGGTSAGRPFTILSRVAFVKVEVTQKVLWVGEAMQVDATPQDQDGQPLPKRSTAWSTTDAGVLTVNAQGVVTPVSEGYAQVRATVDGKIGLEGIYVRATPPYDLMYDSNRGLGGRELWIVSIGGDATPRRWLPEGFLGEDAATNSTGTRIAFVGRDQFLNTDIWVANRDGSGLTRLTTYAGSDDQPTWSPDGNSIAFRSMRGGQSQIWIMDADGSNQRSLMAGADVGLDGQQSHPTFASNGRIYFQVSYASGRSVLASMPVNGTWHDIVEHTPAGMHDSDPAASWNGSNIIVRRKQGAHDAGLVFVDLNGNSLISINYPGYGFMPAWARNDGWLAYSASDNGQLPGNIFVTKPHDFWRKNITVGAAAGGGRNPVFVKR